MNRTNRNFNILSGSEKVPRYFFGSVFKKWFGKKDSTKAPKDNTTREGTGTGTDPAAGVRDAYDYSTPIIGLTNAAIGITNPTGGTSEQQMQRADSIVDGVSSAVSFIPGWGQAVGAALQGVNKLGGMFINTPSWMKNYRTNQNVMSNAAAFGGVADTASRADAASATYGNSGLVGKLTGRNNTTRNLFKTAIDQQTATQDILDESTTARENMLAGYDILSNRRNVNNSGMFNNWSRGSVLSAQKGGKVENTTNDGKPYVIFEGRTSRTPWGTKTTVPIVTTRSLWEEGTGLSWRKAREMGFTDGSYRSNIELMRKLKSGWTPQKDLESQRQSLSVNRPQAPTTPSASDLSIQINKKGGSMRNENNFRKAPKTVQPSYSNSTKSGGLENYRKNITKKKESSKKTVGLKTFKEGGKTGMKLRSKYQMGGEISSNIRNQKFYYGKWLSNRREQLKENGNFRDGAEVEKEVRRQLGDLHNTPYFFDVEELNSHLQKPAKEVMKKNELELMRTYELEKKLKDNIWEDGWQEDGLKLDKLKDKLRYPLSYSPDNVQGYLYYDNENRNNLFNMLNRTLGDTSDSYGVYTDQRVTSVDKNKPDLFSSGIFLSDDMNHTTPLHEYTHAAQNPRTRTIPQVEKIKNIVTDVKDDYLDNPIEIHSRLMEFRYKNKLDPKKKYTPEEIKRLREKSKDFRLFDRYSDDQMLKLINDVANVNFDKGVRNAKVGMKFRIEDKTYKLPKTKQPSYKETTVPGGITKLLKKKSRIKTLRNEKTRMDAVKEAVSKHQFGGMATAAAKESGATGGRPNKIKTTSNKVNLEKPNSQTSVPEQFFSYVRSQGYDPQAEITANEFTNSRGYWDSFSKENNISESFDDLILNANRSVYDYAAKAQDTKKSGIMPVSKGEVVDRIKNNKTTFQYRKEGGKINVIVGGELHARKHKLKDLEGLAESQITNKGVPVIVKEDGGVISQAAEVEREELILHLELTKKLEALMEEGTDEAAIEAGKLLAKELTGNVKDNAGVIEKEVANEND